uniref:Uncharacterized protein n=1 Tax=Rhizophora mucronata TaxID=61149 RepID=A0A2P2R1C3_RHIMU
MIGSEKKKKIANQSAELMPQANLNLSVKKLSYLYCNKIKLRRHCLDYL